jgi:peroxiredoxin
MDYVMNSNIKISHLLCFTSFLLGNSLTNTHPKPDSLPDSRGYIVKVGDPSPNFDLNFPDGSTTSIEQLKGEVIMLQFTASWCSVCRDEMPHIEKEIWRRYKKAGLKVIGIDRDEPVDIVKKFAKEMKITYPLALDLGSQIFYKFAEKDAGVTRNIIINPEGQIVFLTRLFDPEEFKQMIRVIHYHLEEKNNSKIARFKKEITGLENAVKLGFKNSTEKYENKRLLMDLKHELSKVNQLQFYLDRNKPD